LHTASAEMRTTEQIPFTILSTNDPLLTPQNSGLAAGDPARAQETRGESYAAAAAAG